MTSYPCISSGGFLKNHTARTAGHLTKGTWLRALLGTVSSIRQTHQISQINQINQTQGATDHTMPLLKRGFPAGTRLQRWMQIYTLGFMPTPPSAPMIGFPPDEHNHVQELVRIICPMVHHR